MLDNVGSSPLSVAIFVIIKLTSILQSVAGGIPAGMNIFECLVKECDEEASLPEKLVRERVKWVIWLIIQSGKPPT